MATRATEKSSPLGPYRPTLILHGGAGSISRASLPPELWSQYHTSLLKYLTLTRELLDSGASALDAACHAVTQLEDDPLFNCGRGAVFTEQGTIEMEASVMVCSLDPAGPPAGAIKRGAAVSLVRNTRHPILLAKEVLVAPDDEDGLGGTSTMHCHLSGRQVEEWGWNERGLERKPDEWFWTKKRWEEHRRGLHKPSSYTSENIFAPEAPPSKSRIQNNHEDMDSSEIPSQGTVGAVCLDSWGNLAVATSTGGLTNKKAGRIGDTPTIGAGFWAEAWEEPTSCPARRDHDAVQRQLFEHRNQPVLNQAWAKLGELVASCMTVLGPDVRYHQLNKASPAAATSYPQSYHSPFSPADFSARRKRKRRRAVAMSGTGNGDSFLRTNAVRTAAAMCRYSPATSLSDAVTAITGPGGELQSSAGDRWGRTGEGQGGIIGIEVINDEFDFDNERCRYSASPESIYCATTNGGKTTPKKKMGRAVFDFNCGGLFRAYYEHQEREREEKPKVMVFKDEY
ncbi:hypothetical protein A1O1_00525 [Capronia coronata CBS 617.96]|uniref:L-asparaginase n=1 Tax=Capronia coronata CBS 617.96 TaxID=1182541 RepID=W9ZLQ1_9EURO|nr:uncharacterized protein A1O1_00525 [Capronia coronata CBS 617.96]EXJ95404.1 hypothetical protein A1O1_00525 [Capronia coronata CBS 617.96]